MLIMSAQKNEKIGVYVVVPILFIFNKKVL